jgi:hypothetical protein
MLHMKHNKALLFPNQKMSLLSYIQHCYSILHAITSDMFDTFSNSNKLAYILFRDYIAEYQSFIADY